MMRGLWVMGFLCVATARAQPGTELEAADSGPSAATVQPQVPLAKVLEQDRRFEEDLDAADAAKSAAGKESGALPPPSVAPRWAPPPEAPDGRAEARARFAAGRAAFEHALEQKNLKAARVALKRLGELARPLGPAEQQTSATAAVRLGSATRDAKLLQHGVDSWLSACGPNGVPACRKQALLALDAPWAPKASRDRLQSRRDAVKAADGCLAQAEAARPVATKSFPPCLATAQALYRKPKDGLMLARVLLLKAQGVQAKDSSTASRALAQAAQSCPEPRCVLLRRRVLRQQGELLMKADNPSGFVQAALHELKLESAQLPRPALLYAKTPELEAACVSYDAQKGVAACHRLEKRMLGTYVFRDLSREQSPTAGIPTEVARRVSDEFSVLVHDCLLTQARHSGQAGEARYLIHWTLRNDGHVDAVHLDRKDADQGPLAECLRGAFSVWRYPRYAGELQHVDQEFQIRGG